MKQKQKDRWAAYGMTEAGAKLADQWIGKVQEIVDNVDAGVLESLLKEAKWIKSRRESACWTHPTGIVKKEHASIKKS